MKNQLIVKRKGRPIGSKNRIQTITLNNEINSLLLQNNKLMHKYG